VRLGKIEAARPSKILVSSCITMLGHNPEDNIKLSTPPMVNDHETLMHFIFTHLVLQKVKVHHILSLGHMSQIKPVYNITKYSCGFEETYSYLG
jgi:hypothetical protein